MDFPINAGGTPKMESCSTLVNAEKPGSKNLCESAIDTTSNVRRRVLFHPLSTTLPIE